MGSHRTTIKMIVVGAVFILLTITGTFCSNLTISCSDGWEDASSVDLGCILFVRSLRQWIDAQSFCNSMMGSHLVEPLYMPQHIWLSERIGTDGWWIGVTSISSEGRFYYPNHLKEVDPNFPAWRSGQPTNGIENVVEIYQYGWQDYPHTTERYAICQ